MKIKNSSIVCWLARLAFVGLLTGLTTNAHAAAKSWVGSTDANWNTGTSINNNWNTIGVPANSDGVITFNAAGSSGTALNNNIPGPAANPIGINFNGVTFSSSAPAYTISGNTFAIGTTGGGVINNSTALQTFNAVIACGGSGRIISPVSGDITVAGGFTAISTAGLGSITKSGAAKLTISGTNSTVGATTISAGTLSVSKIGNGGINPANTVTLGAAGATTFTYSAAGVWDNAVPGQSVLLLPSGVTILPPLAFGTTITAINTGTRTVTFTPASVGAAFTSASGTWYGDAAGLGLAQNTAGNLVFSGTSTLQYTGATASSDRGFTINAGITATIEVTTAATDLTMSGADTATTGALTKTGAGRLTLKGVMPHTGATTLSAGQLFVKSPGSLSASSAVAVNAGTLGGNGTLGGTVTVASGSGIYIVPGESNVVGTLTVGNLTLNGNTLVYDITNSANLDKIVVSGTLTPNGTTTITIENSPTLANGDYVLLTAGTSLGGSAANFTISPAAPIGKTYTIVHDPSAKTLTLHVADAGAVTYTWIGSGVSDWDIGATANWTNAPGSLVVYADNSDVVFDANGSAHPTVNLTAAVSPKSVTVNAAADYTFSGSGKISGTNGLTKSGAGKLTLSTANDYAGATILNAGTLNLNATETPGTSGPLGTNGTISLLGATLQYSSANTADYSSRFNPAGAQAVNIDTAGQTVTFATALPSAASLSKSGAGKLTLSVSNNISGLVTVSAGTLSLTAPNTFSGVTAFGGTLDLGGTNQTAGTVTISGGTITNGTLTGSSYAAQSGTVAAKLAGQTIALTKTTTGTLVLSTNNTCGPITVNAGTLDITGSQTNSGAGGIAVDGGILTNSGVINIGTAAMYAGNAAASKGIINIGAGTVVAYNAEAGLVSTASGALNVSGGSFTTTQSPVDDANFRIGKVGYGAFTLSGGTVTVQRFQSQGGTGATGISLVSGGTLNVSDSLIVGRNGAAGGQGVLTVSGGTVNHAAATGALSVGNASSVRGELNLTGGTINNSGQSVSFGAGTGTATGIVNLDAGSLTTSSFVNVDGANAVNLNGATLQAAANSTTFLPSGLPVYVNAAFGTFAGGAVIDTVGFTNTFAAALLAPAGNGVSSIPVATQGDGYIGAPYVSISGTGTGATAIADMVDDGTGNGTLKVSAIKITNPGINYSSVPTVTLSGGAPTTAATIGTVTTAANTSGGLVKTGAGVLTLAGANTYTGATVVSNGTLLVNGSLVAGSAVTVHNGAALGGGGTIGGAVTFNSGSHAVFTNAAPLAINGSLVIVGAADVYLALPAGLPVGNYTLATYSTSGSSGSFNSTPIVESGSFAANTTASIVTSGGSVVLQVAANITPTSIAVSSSSQTNGYADSVSFAAALPTAASGSVTFKTNGFALSVNSLVSGVATSDATILLPRGTNLITAEYVGDGNYLGSTNTLEQVVTNHPPVAQANTYSRNGSTIMHLLVANLLTNATDAIDGDIVNWVGVNASTNGVTLSSSGGYLHYYNSNPVDDQFTYTVADGFGGTNSGVITLTYTNGATEVTGTSSISSITGTNPKVLTAYGIPGHTYVTQRATNINQVVWDDIATNALATNAVVISVTDSNPPPGSAYYRLKWRQP